jgi:hypothetical protein
MPNSRELVKILDLAPLERHALLGSRDVRRKVFAAYLAMREKIAIDFLPIIASRIPYINDHSRGHLERVLSNIEALLEGSFPRPSSPVREIPAERVITWADTLILLNALVWHDIGNIFGRKGHAEDVHRCLSFLAEHLYDEYLTQYIVQVARAHSGDEAIRKEIPSSHAAGSYRQEDIHLQFLASILRFADEIDEDNRRIHPSEYDKLDLVPRNSQRYWFFCKANGSIRVATEQTERSLQYWLRVESHISSSDFARRFVTESGNEIAALTEYFRRLFKFEQERVYCNGFMRTAYYHPGVSGIRVHLVTHERDQAPHEARAFQFDLSDTSSSDSLLCEQSLEEIAEYVAQARAGGE